MLQRNPDQRPTAPTWRLLATALRTWRRARTRRTLEALSDETLRDIGITRNEIAHLADRLSYVSGPRFGRGAVTRSEIDARIPG